MTSQNNLPVAVFDLGMVLVEFDIWLSVDALRAAQACDFDPKINPFMGESLDSFETGKIDKIDYLHDLRRRCGLRLSDDVLEETLNRMFGAETPGMREIVETLGQSHLLVLFSNTNPVHYEYLKARYPIVGLFDKIALSYEMGFRKPHAGAYEYVEERFCNNRKPAFYVDDAGENVAAAHERGWMAYQFTTSERLHDYLIGRGILKQSLKPFVIEARPSSYDELHPGRTWTEIYHGTRTACEVLAEQLVRARIASSILEKPEKESLMLPRGRISCVLLVPEQLAEGARSVIGDCPS